MTNSAPTAIAAYYAAEQAHEQNHLNGDGYIAALHKLDDWNPATASDFVHKFIALHHDGGSPNHERLQKLIAQARSLVADKAEDDSTLVAAWEEMREATQALNRPDADTLTNKDQLYQQIDEAEGVIARTPAATLAGIIAKLQAATLSGCDDPADNDAMTAGDYDHLQKASEDWHFDRLVVLSAIQSIRAMKARAKDIRTDWQAAFQAEQIARADSGAFNAEHVAPMNAAHDAGTATLEQVIEQEQAWANITDAHHAAVAALMKTPAPDLQAIAVKLRLGCEGWFFDGSDQSTTALEVIAADVERLSGEA